MTERLTVEMVDELAAREDHEDGSDRYYDLLGTVTSPVLIRAALVEREDATHALETARAELRAALVERDEARAGGVALRGREVCGPACDARYHELRSILGAGQTETIADAARRAIRRADAAEAQLDAARTRGLAGNRCESGNECGRTGCEECQP